LIVKAGFFASGDLDLGDLRRTRERALIADRDRMLYGRQLLNVDLCRNLDLDDLTRTHERAINMRKISKVKVSDQDNGQGDCIA
jgi:hypothetical protein